MLTDRQEIILHFIVDDFLNVSMPISSKRLLEKYPLDVSSATVRNEMAELEDLGYLSKAHTSSGRIPSRKGLRKYINNISKEIESVPSQFDFDINFDDSNLNRLGQGIAQTLSNKTQHLTYVTLTDEKEVVKGVYLTSISDTLVLLVIVFDSEAVKQVTIEKSKDITQNDLEELTRELNFLLVDASINESVNIMTHLGDKRPEVRSFIQMLSHHMNELNSENSVSFYSGLGFLLRDFERDVETLTQLYNDIENNRLPILTNNSNGIEVKFGEEIDTNYQLLSIISSNFTHNDVTLNLMIIGSEFMGYQKIISLLHAFNQKES